MLSGSPRRQEKILHNRSQLLTGPVGARTEDGAADASVHQELSRFSNFLKQQGFKITSQRLLVAEKIFDLKDHFTVDSLSEALKDRRSEISRATIYRIISLMVEAGQLIEHNFGQSVKYYEPVHGKEHHDHMVCTDCGLIQEFHHDDIERLQEAMAEKLGFELIDHSLNLYGKCTVLKATGKCRKAEADKRSE